MVGEQKANIKMQPRPGILQNHARSFRAVIRCGASPMACAFQYKLQQIDEDKNVDSEKTDTNPSKAADDLEDFQGQERGGDGEGEELAPGFFEIEADALDESDAGITVGDEADASQDGIVDERGLFEDEIDEARLRIEAKMAGQEVDLIGNILVQQSVGAEADGDKHQSMEELVNRDEKQKAVAVLSHRSVRIRGHEA